MSDFGLNRVRRKANTQHPQAEDEMYRGEPADDNDNFDWAYRNTKPLVVCKSCKYTEIMYLFY